MAFTKTYDELVADVVRERNVKLYIGLIEVGGTYDPITHVLLWQADFAVRDEAYVRDLIDKANL
jgi:hypothetical protein